MRHYKMGYGLNKYRNRKVTTERYGKFDSKHEYETFLYI